MHSVSMSNEYKSIDFKSTTVYLYINIVFAKIQQQKAYMGIKNMNTVPTTAVMFDFWVNSFFCRNSNSIKLDILFWMLVYVICGRKIILPQILNTTGFIDMVVEFINEITTYCGHRVWWWLAKMRKSQKYDAEKCSSRIQAFLTQK